MLTEETGREMPADAPNVVIVLIDDLGFGAPSTFSRFTGRIAKVTVQVKQP